MPSIPRTISEIEADYRANEWPKVMAALNEMRLSMPVTDRKEMRLAYLNDEYAKTRAELIHETAEFVAKKPELKLWHLKKIEKLTSETKTLKAKILALTKSVHIGITQGEIEAARNFPITNLIKSTRNMAKCPFHSDHSPSLNLKNNFYYCHGCGAKGDTISFVMRMEGLTFGQAITRLNS